MSGLALATKPSSLMEVSDQCAAVEAWAEQCESIPELRDATHRLAAIDEYLTLTSSEGRSRVAAAMRRLEARIGVLLGPAEHGGDRKGDQVAREQLDIERTAQHRFRQMAKHPEVVEEVIAASTDKAPASRRKVIERIKDAKKKHPASTESGKSAAEVAAKVARAKEMAAAGYSSHQIGAEIGIVGMAAFRVRHGIEVPADALVGKRARIDSARVMDELALAAANVAAGAELIDYSELDPARVDEWVSSLSIAISSLTTIRKNLRELTHD